MNRSAVSRLRSWLGAGRAPPDGGFTPKGEPVFIIMFLTSLRLWMPRLGSGGNRRGKGGVRKGSDRGRVVVGKDLMII